VIERVGTKDPDPSARRDGGVDRILLTVQARMRLPAANLMSEKAPVQTETPASSDEVAAAGRLNELAMRNRTLGDDKPAGTNEKLASRADGSSP
jgi:hypothetical protein